MGRQRPWYWIAESGRRSVMRALCTVFALAVGFGLSPGLLAQERAQGQRGQEGEGLAARVHDLNLTDEQETKIAEIRKEARPKVEEAGKELAAAVKEEMEKVHQVLTPEQRQKLQALRDERREHRGDGLAERIAHLRELDLTDSELAQIEEIRKEYHPKITKAMEGLHGMLTDEQKRARADALRAGKKHSEVLASLNLTDDQKEKVATVCKEVTTLVREELEKMRDVLSAEQQEKLAELKDERRDRVRDRMACAIANSTELGLTEDQKTQIAAIRTECRPKVHEAGNKLRSAVREELAAIAAVLKQ
jgi:Spy/CpxP family protein refolding chaperone